MLLVKENIGQLYYYAVIVGIFQNQQTSGYILDIKPDYTGFRRVSGTCWYKCGCNTPLGQHHHSTATAHPTGRLIYVW